MATKPVREGYWPALLRRSARGPSVTPMPVSEIPIPEIETKILERKTDPELKGVSHRRPLQHGKPAYKSARYGQSIIFLAKEHSNGIYRMAASWQWLAGPPFSANLNCCPWAHVPISSEAARRDCKGLQIASAERLFWICKLRWALNARLDGFRAKCCLQK